VKKEVIIIMCAVICKRVDMSDSRKSQLGCEGLNVKMFYAGYRT
jgi:hypothetical protein